MLEQSLPDLCADRIDYNIQGAYFQKFITKDEAKQILRDISFEEGKWVLKSAELAEKLSRFSVFMTKDCWGSAQNSVTSKWLAEAILQGFKTGDVSWHDFHFGTDDQIWRQLSASKDPLIHTPYNFCGMGFTEVSVAFHHLKGLVTQYFRNFCKGSTIHG